MGDLIKFVSDVFRFIVSVEVSIICETCSAVENENSEVVLLRNWGIISLLFWL